VTRMKSARLGAEIGSLLNHVPTKPIWNFRSVYVRDWRLHWRTASGSFARCPARLGANYTAFGSHLNPLPSPLWAADVSIFRSMR
jgi:hypothetical protein